MTEKTYKYEENIWSNMEVETCDVCVEPFVGD